MEPKLIITIMHGQQHIKTKISDNEIYLLIKYIKSVLWRVAKRLSYIQGARCLKVKLGECVLEHVVKLICIEMQLQATLCYRNNMI